MASFSCYTILIVLTNAGVSFKIVNKINKFPIRLGQNVLDIYFFPPFFFSFLRIRSLTNLPTVQVLFKRHIVAKVVKYCFLLKFSYINITIFISIHKFQCNIFELNSIFIQFLLQASRGQKKPLKV